MPDAKRDPPSASSLSGKRVCDYISTLTIKRINKAITHTPRGPAERRSPPPALAEKQRAGGRLRARGLVAAQQGAAPPDSFASALPLAMLRIYHRPMVATRCPVLPRAAARARRGPKASAGLATSSSGGEGGGPSSVILTCSGCGEEVDGSHSPAFHCPNNHSAPEIDHVLVPAPTLPIPPDTSSTNPFVRYRERLYSYRVAAHLGAGDSEYVSMVDELNESLAEVDGNGFHETPLVWHESLNMFAKDESGNVGQSHKARHLQNVMLYLQTLRRFAGRGGEGDPHGLGQRRLAVASCGNAGLAAAVVAAATRWPIDVCIPENADESVVQRLAELGADIHVCGRAPGSYVSTALGQISTSGAADPTLAVCRTLVSEHGSIPFSVQGPECGLAVEGSKTLGWEIVDAVRRDHPEVSALGSIYVQVGGGALGAGLVQGLAEVEGCGGRCVFFGGRFG
jgi:hypothetical protein